MAFNPFHGFRKHRRAVFAVLTIVCMFVFILSFGKGDLFQTLLGRTAARRGPVVTTLYSKKVHEDDLAQLGQRRQLANEFIAEVVLRKAQNLALQSVLQTVQKMKDSNGQQLQAVFQRLQQSLYLGNEERLPQLTEDIRLLSQLRQVTANNTQKPEEGRAVNDLLTVLQTEYWMRDGKRPLGEFYFGGTKKTEDLLDFLIWKHQADVLQIKLDDEGLVKAINYEAFDRPMVNTDYLDNDPDLARFVTGEHFGRGMTRQILKEALKDEFRVLWAKEALVGQEPGLRAYRGTGLGVHQTPSEATPGEFLDYFRKERTTVKVGVLSVPVADFLDKVREQPTEKDLAKYYEKYKDQEPAPDRSEPGFKEPRRVRVEYVRARADSPVFKQEAAQLLALQPGFLRLGAGFNAYAGGGGVAAWLPLVAQPFLFDVRPLAEYEFFRQNSRSWFEPMYRPLADLHETTLLRPQVNAALFAQLACSQLTSAGAFSVPATYLASAYHAEARDRARVLSSSILAGGSSSPFTGAALPIPYVPPVPAMREVQGILAEKVESDLAPKVMRDTMMALLTELPKLKNKSAEARDYVAKMVKEHGLDHFLMAEPRTRYTLAEAPAMQTFKEAYTQAWLLTPRPPLAFADLFFNTTGVYEPQPWATEVRTPRDQMMWMFVSREPYLFWRTEDLPARELPLEKVEAQVADAWRFNQARKLAYQEAKRLAAEVKGLEPKKALEVLEKSKQGKVFELDKVARLLPPSQEVFIGSTREYHRYQPPADKIQYPRPNLAGELLRLEKPGDVIVVRDQPEKHFLVAVLEERTEPTVKDFLDVYEKTPGSDLLWKVMMEQRRLDYQEEVMRKLRADAAGAVDADGKIVLAEGTRAVQGATRDETE